VDSDGEISLSKDGKRLAFATVTVSARIWSLPFDPLAGSKELASRSRRLICRRGFPISRPTASDLYLSLTGKGWRDSNFACNL